MAINSVVLVGRLTKDIELRYTNSGKAIANFTLAVNRNFNSKDGNDTDFINCQIWNTQAENLSKFTHKGSPLGVEGRIQTRSYENSEGKRVYITEVVADRFQLLESKKQAQQSNQGYSSQEYSNQSDVTDEDLPF